MGRALQRHHAPDPAIRRDRSAATRARERRAQVRLRGHPAGQRNRTEHALRVRLGLGPTFIFRSASDDELGQGKWQAGPAAVAGYLGKRWTAYAFAEQWWSFAGDDDRSDTSQLSLNYVLLRSRPHEWQVGMQPTMMVDWKASRDDKVSFPVGLGVGKTVRIGKFPVQFWVEADYYAVRPDDIQGPRWSLNIQIVPVIPGLF